MDAATKAAVKNKAKANDQPLVTFKCDERTMSTVPPGGRAVTEFLGPVEYQRALTAYKVLINSTLDEKDRKLIDEMRWEAK